MESPLAKHRRLFAPTLPSDLKAFTSLKVEIGAPTIAAGDASSVEALFPHTYGQKVVHFSKGGGAQQRAPLKVGVVLSGGQAPGGHNVIAGLFDALKEWHPKSELLGFLGGPSGIVENSAILLTKEQLAPYRNTGGFDLIGSGRTKIETPEQLQAAHTTVAHRGLQGLVIIGGDDSNTNAAVLAEFFAAQGCDTKVVGVPKTIDGDLKNALIETSFGFDTACKTYAEMIGNLARDALSAKKYTHFIKLMGRSASHIALECALQTHPNITLLSEEKKSLQQLTSHVADILQKRIEMGKNYGIVLIAEGLIEYIPEMRALIAELAFIKTQEPQEAAQKLTTKGQATYLTCPPEIQKQLLLDKDPHGNVQVSHIATEKLIMYTVQTELHKRGVATTFNPVSHFLGYEGRAGFPSNFDADYTNALGMTAALLIAHGFSGYMSVVSQLTKPPENWQIGGVPITSFLHMEERKGKLKPVIQKALVDLNQPPYQYFAAQREKWALEDDYQFPGPVQLFGPKEVTEAVTHTLMLEQVNAPQRAQR